MPKPTKNPGLVLDLLHDGDATAIEVEAELGIKRNLALYTLRALERKGLAQEVRRIRVPTGTGHLLTPVFAMARTRKTA